MGSYILGENNLAFQHGFTSDSVVMFLKQWFIIIKSTFLLYYFAKIIIKYYFTYKRFKYEMALVLL